MRRFCFLLVLLSLASLCRADRLLFSRDDAMFVSELNGQGMRRLWSLGGAGLWATSRDGRRVAWLKSGKGTEVADLKTRPVAIFIADTAGRRQKKLTSTDGLKDRNGQRVTGIGPTREGGGVTRLSDWTAVSVGFSAEGRTLYLGLSRADNAESEVATVALDTFTGTAIVDADGNWKVLAPVAQADAFEGMLLGAGSPHGIGESSHLPLTLVRFDDESVRTIPPAESLSGKRPAYGSALWPALSPDGRLAAFSSMPPGLWKCDLAGKGLSRLVATEALRPRFSTDGKALYFLAPRPSTAESPHFDLFRIDLTAPATPVRQLDDLDWFDIVPD
jgi:hypothetical protein